MKVTGASAAASPSPGESPRTAAAIATSPIHATRFIPAPRAAEWPPGPVRRRRRPVAPPRPSATVPDAALAVPRAAPRQRQPLDRRDGPKEDEGHRAQVDDRREHEVDMELGVRVDHQEPQPPRGADPLADHR